MDKLRGIKRRETPLSVSAKSVGNPKPCPHDGFANAKAAMYRGGDLAAPRGDGGMFQRHGRSAIAVGG
mgnify:CR=1 FL=1